MAGGATLLFGTAWGRPDCGKNGRLTRRELGQQLSIDPRLLDSLLAAYVAFGLLTVSQENGERVYRTAWGGNAH